MHALLTSGSSKALHLPPGNYWISMLQGLVHALPQAISDAFGEGQAASVTATPQPPAPEPQCSPLWPPSAPSFLTATPLGQFTPSLRGSVTLCWAGPFNLGCVDEYQVRAGATAGAARPACPAHLFQLLALAWGAEPHWRSRRRRLLALHALGGQLSENMASCQLSLIAVLRHPVLPLPQVTVQEQAPSNRMLGNYLEK